MGTCGRKKSVGTMVSWHSMWTGVPDAVFFPPPPPSSFLFSTVAISHICQASHTSSYQQPTTSSSRPHLSCLNSVPSIIQLLLVPYASFPKRSFFSLIPPPFLYASYSIFKLLFPSAVGNTSVSHIKMNVYTRSTCAFLLVAYLPGTISLFS